MFTKLKNIYSLDFASDKVLTHTNTKYLIINVALFVLPFFLGGSQIVLGSIVNFLLIYIALNFKQAKLLPAIFLPAIASFLSNTILGSATIYLAILMPFIWLSNGLFIMTIRGLVHNKKNLFLSLGTASVLKAFFLFGITFILVSQFKFPNVLLLAMGLLQLATAIIATTIYSLALSKK
jgi:hypothetical protein